MIIKTYIDKLNLFLNLTLLIIETRKTYNVRQRSDEYYINNKIMYLYDIT